MKELERFAVELQSKMDDSRPLTARTEPTTSSHWDVNSQNAYFDDIALILLQEFMVHIIAKDYSQALDVSQKILRFDPENSIILEYQPVIIERIGQLKKRVELGLPLESEETSDESDESSDEDSTDSDSNSNSKAESDEETSNESDKSHASSIEEEEENDNESVKTKDDSINNA